MDPGGGQPSRVQVGSQALSTASRKKERACVFDISWTLLAVTQVVVRVRPVMPHEIQDEMAVTCSSDASKVQVRSRPRARGGCRGGAERKCRPSVPAWMHAWLAGWQAQGLVQAPARYACHGGDGCTHSASITCT